MDFYMDNNFKKLPMLVFVHLNMTCALHATQTVPCPQDSDTPLPPLLKKKKQPPTTAALKVVFQPAQSSFPLWLGATNSSCFITGF